MLENIYESTPDFVNTEGIKWWLDKSLTKYAQSSDFHGTCLPDCFVFFVEETNGMKSRVIVNDGQIVFDSQRLEDIGVHIDMMKLIERRNDK